MDHMTQEGGVKVLSKCEPREVRREGGEGKLLVSWFDAGLASTCLGEWDTVLFATGM